MTERYSHPFRRGRKGNGGGEDGGILFALKFDFAGTLGDWNLPTLIVILQASTKHRLFCLSNIFAEHFDCYVVVGIILDQP